MRFIENVFVSDSIEDINTVVYSLKRDIPLLGIYVICTDESGKCEIMPSAEFLGRFGKSEEKTVCGLASGKRAAYSLFADMISYGEKQGWKADDFGKNILKEQ